MTLPLHALGGQHDPRAAAVSQSVEYITVRASAHHRERKKIYGRTQNTNVTLGASGVRMISLRDGGEGSEPEKKRGGEYERTTK